MATSSKITSPNELTHLQMSKLNQLMILIQVISIIFVFSVIEYTNYLKKEALAINLTQSISTSIIINDYRRVIETLTPATQNEFSSFTVQMIVNGKNIDVVNHEQKYFLKQIQIPIFSDHSQKNVIANITFRFQLFNSLLDWKIFILIGILLSSTYLIMLQFKKRFIQEQELQKKQSEMELMIQFAKQVSHDIRSPLAALSMATKSLNQIPENQRVMIRNSVQRITDIANTLLKYKPNHQLPENNQSSNEIPLQLQTEYLPALLDSIVSEKRVQYRENQFLQIDLTLNQNYACFANVDSRELKRVLSNLINNSVEAFENQKGKINVDLKKISQNLIIEISDNGKGIPEHILNKLGQLGITHGKENSDSGSGLGVYHAIQSVRKMNGQMKIESKQNQGTKITITLPEQNTPAWFMERINLTENAVLVSLDDDLSIHSIWENRLNLYRTQAPGLQHYSFTSIEEFKSWYSQKNVIDSSLIAAKELFFVVDYEFLSQKENGLDVIQGLNIANQSVLVTSRYDEQSIRQKCYEINLKLIPKNMVEFVPIQITKPKVRYDAVLIDDDTVCIHPIWKDYAKMNTKNLLALTTYEEFLKFAPEISEDSRFFVDSSLANNVKGEAISQKIHEMGFKNISMCTGYEPDHFPSMPWIQEILGKEPNF